jgi:3-oxoadipate enol-lactonase
MGGYILFAFHRLFPARVKGLILADTRARADAADERAGRLQMIRTAESQGAQAVADIMLPRLLSPDTIAMRSDLASKVRVMIINNSPETIVADLHAMIDRADSIPTLSKIACPTLVIVGELDRGTPPSDAQFMAERITGARLAVLPEAAHLSNLENPDAFNMAMHAFLNEIEGDRAGKQPTSKQIG